MATIILPSPGVLASFEEFLKQLPVDCEMAYEFKVFARGRKVKTPGELLQLVMLYCRLDMSLRGGGGDFTLLHERRSDTAVRQRLMACGPWLKALLAAHDARLRRGRRGVSAAGRVDSTPLTGTAPDGTACRVHLVLDLAAPTLHEADGTGVDVGESLERLAFVAGDGQ